jgi:cell division protease FtsH
VLRHARRGARRQRRSAIVNPEQNKKVQFSVIWVLAAMLVVFGIQYFLSTQKVTLNYSDFKTAVAQHKVQGLQISATGIQGIIKTDKGDEVFQTTRVDDPGLVPLLEQNGITYTGVLPSNILGSIVSWVLPLLLMFVFWNFMMRRMGSGGPGVLSIGKSKARVFADTNARKVTFADVAGIDEAKEELTEIVEFLQTPRRFEELGGRIPRGVLLVGAPGTGKTLLARAVAGEAGVPFFNISGSEFVEMFVGVGAARVRDLFAQAGAKAPCIIFIDELDALGKARGYNPMGGYDEREQTLNQLLTEMDGFDTRKGVIIMGATNRPEILDPALLRPGRFDRQVVVDRPDLVGREAILNVHIKGVKLAPDIDLKAIARRTPGFVGADLANIINEAALLAARRRKSDVGMAEFSEAIDRVVAGLEKKKRLISPREKKVVAYHEAGHAVVSQCLGSSDTVQKISIVPRGIAALGYTIQLPTEDRYLVMKKELEERLASLLGGRVAEEVFFNDISTGAQNDLARATDTARAMVKEYGMSDLGLSSYERPHNPFLKGDAWMPNEKEYSEKTAAEIDVEVRRILEKAYQTAKAVLEGKRDKVEALAALLLEKEVIEREEFLKVVACEAAPAQEA